MNDFPAPPPRPWRTVVVGLGQVGSRFDEEPGRTVAWSHVGAYLARPQWFDLVGAVEVKPENVAAFRARCPSVPVGASVEEAVATHQPEVVSICTPAGSHGDVLSRLLGCAALRLVWCEKPLSGDLDEAGRMVDSCRQRNIPMMVSHNRRWLPLWVAAREIADSGRLGPVRSVRVAMPNRLFSIGSHAVDLALMLGGPVEAVAPQAWPTLDEGGEPAVGALLRYRSGAAGVIQVVGRKHQLMVEAEVIGDDGRLLAREDRGTLAVEMFQASARYGGYRELGDAEVRRFPGPTEVSAFVAMADSAAAHLAAGLPLPCDGGSALEVQQVLGRMAAGIG